MTQNHKCKNPGGFLNFFLKSLFIFGFYPPILFISIVIFILAELLARYSQVNLPILENLVIT